MNDDLGEPLVYRCSNCGTAFENGVADPGPEGEPRCPQCGLWEATAVEDEMPQFVVYRTTRFR